MFSDQQKEDAERMGFCYPQILQIGLARLRRNQKEEI